MKLICKECESELEFTDLYGDGTELVVNDCFCVKERAESAYNDGYRAGLGDANCDDDWNDGYKEGYAEAEEYYKENADDYCSHEKE